jgi:hypothetical protein
MATRFKVRDGYTLLRKGKPTEERYVDADDPETSGQMHKLEPASADEVKTHEAEQAIMLRATDLASVGRMRRDELLEKYESAFGEPAPEDMTVSKLKKALRKRYYEMIDEDVSGEDEAEEG